MQIIKLRNKKGETMAEVLMASLVISLAMILLVSMIVASFKIIRDSEHQFHGYYLIRNVVETGELPADDKVSLNIDDKGTLSISNESGSKLLTNPVDVFHVSGNDESDHLPDFYRYRYKPITN